MDSITVPRRSAAARVAAILDSSRPRLCSRYRFAPATCALDMGYNNGRVYRECAEPDPIAVIPLRKNSGLGQSSIPRKTDE